MATITNILNTNNKQIDIQGDTGALNIGTSANSTTITIGNTTGTSTLTINGSTSNSANITINSGISTAPVSSHTATVAFGTSLTLATPVQNTLGYNILLNITIITNSTQSGTTFNIGIDTAASPAVSPVIVTSTNIGIKVFTFGVIVPNNYYVVVTKGATAGTLTSITTFATAL